jgi:hypothetical protein
VRSQSIFERLARAVKTHHGSVGGEPQFLGHLGDRCPLNDDAAQNLDVVRLQLHCLNHHAPTVNPRVFGGCRSFGIEGDYGDTSTPQLVLHDVAHDTTEPSRNPRALTHLMAVRQCPLDRNLQHFLGIDLTAPAQPHDVEQVTSLLDNRNA